MEQKIIEYGGAEYQKMIDLRTKILRVPLGLTFSEDFLLRDKDDILLACLKNEEMIGCCILTFIDSQIIQLRQMAILDSFQKKGIGSALIEFAEKTAKDNLATTMILHARKVVADFYLKNGYHIEGEEFLEVNIPHLSMKKYLFQI